MKTTKFNTSWQLTRVNARKIKDPLQKILYVLSYLEAYPSIHSYKRVMNWIKMTRLGYKQQRIIFDKYIDSLEANESKYKSIEDSPTAFSQFSNESILEIYKDLSKRKYGFQIKAIPKEHTAYMLLLEKYMQEKGLKK